MPPTTKSLVWNSATIRKLVARNDIQTRDELSKRIGTPRSTVYRVFDANWDGPVSTTVANALISTFEVEAGHIITTRGGRK